MVTTTQSTVPWTGAQPFITAGMQHGAGPATIRARASSAPNFQTYVPFSSQTQQSLGQIGQIAGRGNPLAGQSMGAISGILSGDINNKYNQLYASADNPQFAQAVQGQSDQIAADVQRQFGGLGRIGSAADTGALTQQIGDFREKALANQWNQNIANQRGILSDQSTDAARGGRGGAGSLSAAIPAGGAPRPGRVGPRGSRSAALQSRLDKFNTNQQAPWNRLGAYNQNIGGTGGTSPGFGKQTVAQPINWRGILSGAGLAGASLLSGGGGGGGGGFLDCLRSGG